MNNPDISVIIPTYNHERFIGRTLRSILDQSIDRNKYEVIVINDFSNDNSKQIISRFKNDLEYFENEKNEGLPSSLNIGTKKARGKYMVRLDSDDYVNRKFLELLYEFLNWNEEFDAVSCDYFIVNDNEEVIKREDSSINPIGCGIMFKMDKILDIGLYNKDFLLHEDKELMMRFKKKYKLHNIKLPLYRYRKHSNNITNDQKNIEKFHKKLKGL